MFSNRLHSSEGLNFFSLEACAVVICISYNVMFDLILFKDHTKAELDAWKIVRVSENFRVIALGLPVPRFSGNPLDPPLRSRFQARDIYYLPFKVSMNKDNLFCKQFFYS